VGLQESRKARAIGARAAARRTGIARTWHMLWGKKKDFSVSSNPSWGKKLFGVEARTLFSGRGEYEKNGLASVVVVVEVWLGAHVFFLSKKRSTNRWSSARLEIPFFKI